MNTLEGYDVRESKRAKNNYSIITHFPVVPNWNKGPRAGLEPAIPTTKRPQT
jgi:hypothetical protein